MENWEVALTLKRIADLLSLKGENEYKIRAYLRASKNISRHKENVVKLVDEGRLRELNGIGSTLAKKIEEIITTGKSDLLLQLQSELPTELLSLFNIPGVGRKIGGLIYKELNVQDLDDVEKAAKEGRIRSLPGLGAKTEEKIIKGLSNIKNKKPRYNLKIACFLSIKIQEWLYTRVEPEYCNLVGSLRRGQETVSNINYLIGFDEGKGLDESIHELIEQLYFFSLVNKETIRREAEGKIVTFDTIWGLPVMLIIVPRKCFVPALIYYTGSREHVNKLRGQAKAKGYEFLATGLYKNGVVVGLREETDFYRLLGISYIPPELREDRGEVYAATVGKLPHLINYNDIKGDLHLHSNWSDGVNSIEELALAGEERGYQYIAITDHSHSLKIAGGLDEKRLSHQQEYISGIQENFNISILSGIEVDILTDCSLDLPDSILSKLDIVIASIHSGFNQSKEKINSRLFAAMENPYVNIIAHPSGRLLGEREPYSVDMELLLERAVQTGTFLEINSSPDRLDLNDIYVKMGKEIGVSMVISTDAHSLSGMNYFKYGIMVARRGWLEKKNVINTFSVEELIKELRKKRRHA